MKKHKKRDIAISAACLLGLNVVAVVVMTVFREDQDPALLAPPSSGVASLEAARPTARLVSRDEVARAQYLFEAPVEAAPRGGPARFTGQVIDAGGGGVADAEVLLAVDETAGSPRYRVGAVAGRTTTDGDGRFALSVPARPLLHLLRVTHPRFAGRVTRGLSSRPGETVGTTVRLASSATVRGRVVGDSGAVVGDAEVIVFDLSGSSAHSDLEVERRAAVDRNGSFELGGLAEGRKRISVFGTGTSTSWTDVVLAPGATVDVELQVTGGRSILGIVTNSATGAPVAGARVTAVPREGLELFPERSYPAVRTDDQGRFRCDGLRDGAYHLLVRAKGYLANGLGEPASPDRPDALIPLALGPEVTGQVVDSRSGAPVAFDSIAVLAGSVHGVPLDEVLVLDASDGRFALRVGRGYGRVVLRATTPEGEIGFSEPLALDRGLWHYAEIVMAPPAVVRGRCLDEGGNPLARIGVSLVRARPGLPGPAARSGAPDLPVADVFSSSDGAFELVGVVAGSYRLIASGSEHVGPVGGSPLIVKQGDAVACELVLGRAGGVHGVVRDPGGRPVGGVTVRVSSSATDLAGPSVAARADETGRYVFPRLPAGQYSVSADSAGSLYQRIAGAAAAPTVLVEAGTVTSLDLHTAPPR